ncbi:hypothetical protein Poli38472_012356 [Pythium oligandrum]|uniref:Uncharacterized protein n=1 Tax=Pythium oligandrum TaxID=41045 RepID=A0A8K1CPQ8_PYTOL|nr:hypothetical protein Poli38472_012356 [Pythium oligandrum]|eukprot:TMW67240.1 hypothetical protein Poli38472_012356 [Pythium oligandrum]
MGVAEAAPKKKTRSTAQARKDEIRVLKAQLGPLSERLEELQHAKLLEGHDNMDDVMLENALLRSGLKQTDLTLAGAQSLLASSRAALGRNPLDVQIYLSAEPTLRHQALATLRDARLREATDFILERVRYLDLRRPHQEKEAFELPDGDHISLRCEVVPFRTNASVKQAFEDVVMAVKQEEFTVWESLGVTTTFESDESPDLTYSQARGISTTPDGTQFEKNTAHFLMYSEGNNQLSVPHGLVVMHPIAYDEQFPYQPQFRVREDVTVVFLVCPLPGGGVVGIRWAHMRIHKPLCGITRVQEMRIRDISARWGDIVRNNVLEAVFGRMLHV